MGDAVQIGQEQRKVEGGAQEVGGHDAARHRPGRVLRLLRHVAGHVKHEDEVLGGEKRARGKKVSTLRMRQDSRGAAAARTWAISRPLAMVYAVCPLVVPKPDMPEVVRPLILAFWA